jgi:hypothetical protein
MIASDKSIETMIVEKSVALGASLAGIARVKDLKASKSYEVYAKRPYYEELRNPMRYTLKGRTTKNMN